MAPAIGADLRKVVEPSLAVSSLEHMETAGTENLPIDETLHDDDDTIAHYPTKEQVEAAVQRELDKVGLTRDQLEAQAKAGRFDS